VLSIAPNPLIELFSQSYCPGGDNFIEVNPRLCRGSRRWRDWHFRDAWVVARGQGASGQKASAGWALILEAPTGFRRMGRADHRATGRSRLPGENAFIEGSESWPDWTMKQEPPHGFCPEGPCPRAWHGTEGHL